jgi:hypothetical protein
MFKDQNPTVRILAQSIRNEDAIFIGWQRLRPGKVLAVYNITAAGHPSLGSTVTDNDLRKLNLQVPVAPLPQRTREEVLIVTN